MRGIVERIEKIERDIANPKKRTADAFVERQGLISGIIKELNAMSNFDLKFRLLEKATRLKWENPLRCFHERFKEKQIVNVPAGFIKKEPLGSGYRVYFPAHFEDFEEEGLKISCSKVPGGYESDLHYHADFIERVNVAGGLIMLKAPMGESTNITMLKTGSYALVPEGVSHNYQAKEESIIFTEKLGRKSVVKHRDEILPLNRTQIMTARKFSLKNGSAVEIYSRISYLDHSHNIGFILPGSGEKTDYTIEKQTFYFCLEGSMFVAKNVDGGWVEKEALSPSITIMKPDNTVRLEFTKDAKVLFIADH